MRRGKERLVIVFVTLSYWTCQIAVKGNTLKNDTAEGDKYVENATTVEENDDTKNLYADTSDLNNLDLYSDTPTFNERIQQMPLKLGLQFLTAKYGLSGSLDNAKQAGMNIYEGAKGGVKTVTDFIGDGFGNARFLLFGAK